MSDFDFTGSFAQVYDRYLVPMDFAPYASRLAKRVNALAPRRVLETGAGTGVVTRELARILPSPRHHGYRPQRADDCTRTSQYWR
jgi:ubiquinone/menaquinone biosynthesis C-methylase UbiE